jgi:putative membrane protein
MVYLYAKSLHIIFVVSWFAGLFYLPRLFVYHTEAKSLPDAERAVLCGALSKWESRLFNAIMVPAMWLTLISGTTMLYINSDWLLQGWMQVKLGFVFVLVCFHFYSRHLLIRLKAGEFPLTSLQLRLFNEVATVILFAIVFLVVLKNTVDWLWGVAGLIAFAFLIMSAVKIVKLSRERKRQAEK